MLRAMRLGTLALVVMLLAACKSRSPVLEHLADPPSQRLDLALPPLSCSNIQRCVAACPRGAALPRCADVCVARLTPAARPFYDALQACVAPSCANADASGPCLDPGSLGCKMCVMSHCGSLASTCLLH
jgi:hypothetical protein